MGHRSKWPWWGMDRGQWWGQVVVVGDGSGAGGPDGGWGQVGLGSGVGGGPGGGWDQVAMVVMGQVQVVVGAGGPGGNGARWSWPGPRPQSGSDTLWPCHPGSSWAVRYEVKNTRQTLVLSKVKCVTRQPGGAENNPCLHSANSWLPRSPPPPLPSQS